MAKTTQFDDVKPIDPAAAQRLVDQAMRQQRPGSVHRPSAGLHKQSQKPSQVLRTRQPEATHPEIERRKTPAPVTQKVTPSRTETASQAIPKHPEVHRGHIEPALITPEPTARAQRTTAQKMLDDQVENYLRHSPPALESADRPRRRFFSFGRSLAAIAAILIMAGAAYAYTEREDIYYAIAGNSAGISARSPDFKPNGYVLSESVEYSPGNVTATYISSTTNQTYIVTQTSTTWDSRALYDNYISISFSDDHQTIRKNGLTLYLYGEGNISWINGGIWYDVESDNALSPEQLIDIAISL